MKLFLNSRSKIPPRPQGQRTEAPEANSNFHQPFGFGDNGFHLSFGIGAFPFGFFTYGNLRPNARTQNQNFPGLEEDQFLSKVFLWLAILFLIWLIFT